MRNLQFMEERRILIVEDEVKIADTLRLGLRENGYEADVAYDGNAGLEKFRTNHYSLIVIDINLPGMNGLDLCKVIRNQNSSIPVIMLTSMSTITDKIEGYNAG